MLHKIKGFRFLKNNGEIIDPTLFPHIETIAVGGVTVYVLKDTSADTTGANFTASTSNTGKYLMTYNSITSEFFYSLNGITKLLPSTINAIYRAYTSGGTVNGVIDIRIVTSSGSTRTTIATSVCASGNWGTSYATYTGANYSFDGYDVVDETDYLVIAYYANVTVNESGGTCYLRVDDNTLAVSNQTQSQNWAWNTSVSRTFSQVWKSLSNINKNISLSFGYSKWLDYAWKYRKAHIINSQSGAGIGYAVRVVVYYGSGTDSGENVYLNGKCKTDFGDIRFTDASGNLLNYWIESKTNSDNALFWVKINGDLSSSAQLIYIYYGNSSATTTSNGSNTFIFFDDFTSYNADTDINNQGGWITRRVGGSGEAKIRVYNGKNHLRLSSTDGCTHVVHSCTASNAGVALRVREVADDWNECFLTGFSNGNARSDGHPDTAYDFAWWGWDGANSRIRKFLPDGAIDLTSISDSSTNGTYYTIEDRWFGSLLVGMRDDTQKMSATDSSFSSFSYIYLGEWAWSSRYIDFVAVRKYVDPEPSHGSWFSEETHNIVVKILQSISKNFNNIGKAISLVSNIAKKVYSSISYSYNVVSSLVIYVSLSLIYSSKSMISKLLSVLHTLDINIFKTLTQSFNTLVLTKSLLDFRHRLSTIVSKPLIIVSNTLNNLVKTMSYVYNSLSNASKELLSISSLRNNLTKLLLIGFLILKSVIEKNAVVDYLLRKTLHMEFEFSNRLLKNVSTILIFTWLLLKNIFVDFVIVLKKKVIKLIITAYLLGKTAILKLSKKEVEIKSICQEQETIKRK